MSLLTLPHESDRLTHTATCTDGALWASPVGCDWEQTRTRVFKMHRRVGCAGMLSSFYKTDQSEWWPLLPWGGVREGRERSTAAPVQPQGCLYVKNIYMHLCPCLTNQLKQGRFSQENTQDDLWAKREYYLQRAAWQCQRGWQGPQGECDNIEKLNSNLGYSGFYVVTSCCK